jgi:hypothetical protein
MVGNVNPSIEALEVSGFERLARKEKAILLRGPLGSKVYCLTAGSDYHFVIEPDHKAVADRAMSVIPFIESGERHSSAFLGFPKKVKNSEAGYESEYGHRYIFASSDHLTVAAGLYDQHIMSGED